MTMNHMTTLLPRGLLLAVLAAAWWQMFRPHGSAGLAMVTTLLVVALLVVHGRWLRSMARRTILAFEFPRFLRGKVHEAYPALDDRQLTDVERGLRQFFIASASARGRFVAMPSKVVDALWHEFILHTRAYEGFCRRAFGRLLHHTPAEALPPGASARDQRFAGLRRAWYWSCREEGIDPRRPSRLPVLFALDAALAIPGGYHYVPDCRLLGADRGDTHCGDAFGCGSSCGSSGGSDGGSDASGDGGGDGGGCGGGD
ncbi:MAG: hypothetical protein KF788_18745 [Piscinibacter sp.]|nr:hypothetical protein [Piscinibacter sp.]